MTTTLRPAGPEERGPDGSRARDFTVCVNSRPVGAMSTSRPSSVAQSVSRFGWLQSALSTTAPAGSTVHQRLVLLGYGVRSAAPDATSTRHPPALSSSKSIEWSIQRQLE